MSVNLQPAVIGPSCHVGDCTNCGDSRCEHNCHVLNAWRLSGYAEATAMGAAWSALAVLDQRGRERAVKWLALRIHEETVGREPESDDPWERKEPPF